VLGDDIAGLFQNAEVPASSVGLGTGARASLNLRPPFADAREA
jgi:hypothetical protein